MSLHSYQFSHHSLPAHFFNDGAQFTKLLLLDGALFLRYIWKTTGEDLEDSQAVTPYSLGFEPRRHEKFELYLITMPEPVETPEAFYILLATDGRKHSYFTLEFGENLVDEEEAKPCFIHCEWRADGTQKNHGKLGSSDIELFVRKCIKLLK